MNDIFIHLIRLIINLTVSNSFPIDVSLESITILSLFWGVQFSLLDYVLPEISNSLRNSFILMLCFKLLK